MNCSERALTFSCRGHQLVGVLAEPAQPRGDVGVVVVVGGPQYRAGSHRLFVRLARALAEAGHPVLRFDARGMGDSEGEFPGFEHLAPDIGAAIDALQAHCPGVRRVVLWGLCDAASAALLYWGETRDARVAGMALSNPWVRSVASQARAHVKHYYGQRLRQPEFWAKLLKGQVAAQALKGFMRNLSLSRAVGAGGDGGSFQSRMAQAWQEFGRPLLLLMSGDDYTAREFEEYVAADSAWAGALQRPGLLREDLPGADHTFSGADAHAWVARCSRQWLDALPAAAASASSRDSLHRNQT